MKKGQNTFVTFLKLMKVRHTTAFSNRFFNEHPHKYSLFGLSKMLFAYGVQNAGTRIMNKEKDIFNIETPFIAHTGNDFVTVYKVDPDQVHFFRDGEKIIIPVSEFIQIWSGIILLVEIKPDSGEPNYIAHRKENLLYIARKSILILAIILFFGIVYSWHSLSADLGFILLLIVNFFGAYISFLLVLQQVHINSRYADKICSLFNKSDCNNVLESKAAKLLGVFGWSEIGLGYFVANIVILMFFPQMISFFVLINILVLPYTVWSVWYQKIKIQQWCPLCLIVQILLWVIFVLNVFFGYIQFPDFHIQNILIIGCIFTISIFTFNILLSKLSEENQVIELRQEINSIKANKEVFKTLLMQQTYY
ncbi:hypothetical protein LJC43_04335 [Parabacteroides sp. OttesenSCG-928-G21]|nr:hypothetical protein [Parabacteroides sp. OttesenSCG-928-G21]